MTLQEFINKYNGHKVDVDGFPASNPYQCMDLYRKYVEEVWGRQQTPTVQGAFQVFDSIGQGYERFTTGHIMPGDVMTWTENYAPNGHIGIVVSSNATTMQVFEQNNPVGSSCGIHTRNYGNIKGWFRPVVSSVLAKTFMKVTVADNAHWPSLQTQLNTLKEWFIHYSNNRFEPVFDIKQTNFTTVPFIPINGILAPDYNWYRTNVTPLATGQATLLLIPYSQWQSNNSITWGWMTWGDPNKPVRIQCTGDENEILPSNTEGGYDTAPIFVHRAFHEMCHMFFFLTGQEDRTHEFLLVEEDRKAALMDYVDWRALQAALVKIHN